MVGSVCGEPSERRWGAQLTRPTAGTGGEGREAGVPIRHSHPSPFAPGRLALTGHDCPVVWAQRKPHRASRKQTAPPDMATHSSGPGVSRGHGQGSSSQWVLLQICRGRKQKARPRCRPPQPHAFKLSGQGLTPRTPHPRPSLNFPAAIPCQCCWEDFIR